MSGLDLDPGRIAPMGDSALLVGTASAAEARRLAAALRLIEPDAVVVPGLSSVLIEGDGDLLASIARAMGSRADDELGARLHQIEVVLDGDDLDEVLEMTALSLAELVLAVESELEVAVLGFSPGFGYLTGLSGPLAELPRRPTPRPRVPAGSLAVAAGMAALYPQSSPGGWWLIGSTTTTLFDPSDEQRPSLFAAGDRVAFTVVEHHERPRRALERRPIRPPAGMPSALRVTAGAPGAVVVDGGRRARAAVGVPSAAAFDPERAELAAELVGGVAALELPATGLRLEALAAVEVAGVDLELEVDGRAVPSDRSVGLSPGQEVGVVGIRGARGYLGISAGPVIAAVLGSMGTDALAGVGPGALEAGDEIAGRSLGVVAASQRRLPSVGSPLRLRYRPGPQASVVEGGLSGLVATVLPSSNRVGIRLEPTSGPIDRAEGELRSFAMVAGAIQLPPDGLPIVLGPDHATLGGYPVVGVVVAEDLSLLGRLDPGREVQLIEEDGTAADDPSPSEAGER